jgi:putative two-component system response regulator
MRARRGGEILVVEVDTTFLQSLLPALEETGHKIRVCGTLGEARTDLSTQPCDVVLCAERLPDGAGQDLCWWVKEDSGNPLLQTVSVALLSPEPNAGGTGDLKLPLEAPPSAVEHTPLSPIPADSYSPAGTASIRGHLSRSAHFTEQSPADDTIWKSSKVTDILLQVESLLRMRRYLLEIANSLTALMAVAEGVEEQDTRARGHCKRLAIISIELGAVLGCDDWEISALERGAYLHDVGKVLIPGDLLLKREPLSPREMEIIRSHCVLGERLCQPLAALEPVLPIIRHHHERLNGTGYPDGLHGEDIPLLAQVLTIADIYESLRMWRPYRAPLAEAPAIAIMHQEVRQGFWDAHIFDAFRIHVLPGLEERLRSSHALWPGQPG